MADEEDKQVTNNFDLYQEKVKREIKSLKDVCVDFAKSCQQKEKEVTAVFLKLKETEISFSENVDGLQKELEKLKAEMIVKENKLTVAEKNLQAFKTMLNTSEKQCKEHKYLINQMREELKGMNELAEKDIQSQSTIAYLQDKLQQQQKENNKLQTDKQQLNNANKLMKSACQQKDAEAKHYYAESQRYSLEYENSAKQLQGSQEARNQLEKEKKYLFLRLSRIADTNPTYRNPNIADLGDPNRPTKQAEVFSEIYDDEWNDAYETVLDDEEKNKINFMLNLLKNVDTICEDVSKRHADAITDGLTQMVVRVKVRKCPTDPKRKYDERGLKLVDTHLESTACTADVLATGKFRKNEPSTSKRNDGEQGDALVTNGNLSKENKGTNPSPSKIGNRNNHLEPTKIGNKQIDETATEGKASTDNANISATQSENISLDTRDGADVFNDNTVIKDNEQHEQAEVDSEFGEGKDEKVDKKTSTVNPEQKNTGYMEKIEYEEKSEVIQFDFDELPTEQKLIIEDIRHRIKYDMTEKVIEAICNAVIEEMGPNQTDEIRTYISKCSLFCWTARWHNPPVYVDFMEVTDNMRFDMNVYKPYTKTGPIVDYIVWPPIYLFKGGPMLCKGVAQGKRN